MKVTASVVDYAHGGLPYGAREMDPVEKVMKKCTLCVDRIYNDNLPEEDKVPSCVRTCPAGARHFGDLGDPNSSVSILVEKRGGDRSYARARNSAHK